MRQQYMLKDSPCCDCLVHCCCESCALCQEYRELENRGFDMERGMYIVLLCSSIIFILLSFGVQFYVVLVL